MYVSKVGAAGAMRGTDHQLEQEAADCSQMKYFWTSHLASFQPSPANSAQSSSPKLLGSFGFQYFIKLKSSSTA